MLVINIPGKKSLEIKHLILDFNGTLAIDGKLIEGTKPLLELLGKQLIIHVLTADTFGSAEKELAGINCILKVLSPEMQDMQKESPGQWSQAAHQPEKVKPESFAMAIKKGTAEKVC
ncbi:MAG: hypothetical protein WC384_12515 [Prolixibacteraceae bacterium]|jgi:soluble P-type ATPase